MNINLNISEWEIATRLGLTCVLAGLIGLERESQGRPAGLRTHILVSLGSCLMMMISKYGFSEFDNIDPARLAAQVVSGIGFLGAGTILREGSSVKGLTTAACLWVVAGIGLAIGNGMYFAGLLSTAVSVLILLWLTPVEKKIFSSNTCQILIYLNNTDLLSSLLDPTNLIDLSIKHLELKNNETNHEIVLKLTVYNEKFDKEMVLQRFLQKEGVKKVVLR